MRSSGKDFAVLDSLIYPLVFNSRHAVESYLKGIYCNYANATEAEFKDYLNNCGHNLSQAWSMVKPYLKKGKKHIGSTINIGVLEHYIRELNKFDSNSMVMRYPIDKSLDKMHEKPLHFDYVNFHARMEDLFTALETINYELSNQITTLEPQEKREEMISQIRQHSQNLKDYKCSLSQAIEKSQDRSDNHDILTRILEPMPHIDYLKSQCDDFLIVAETLFYAGRSVREEEIRLSKNPHKAKDEFLSICVEHMSHNNLEFGKPLTDGDINIWGKSPDALLENIQTAVAILEHSSP